MGHLAETRRLIAAHTVSGCGMMHHYTWTHGRELPPCEAVQRDGRLDCAHTRHPGLGDAIGALASELEVPLDFIKSVRGVVAVAHDALWIADLLAIELGDIGLVSNPRSRELSSDEQRVLEEIGALQQDGTIDTSRCEAAIKSAQAIGASLLLSVRSALLSVIDAIEEGAGAETVARMVAAGRAYLTQSVRGAEELIFRERACDSSDEARSACSMKVVL